MDRNLLSNRLSDCSSQASAPSTPGYLEGSIPTWDLSPGIQDLMTASLQWDCANPPPDSASAAGALPDRKIRELSKHSSSWTVTVLIPQLLRLGTGRTPGHRQTLVLSK